MPGIAAPNYRLPAATHIGRVVLQVSDLERSLDYYQGVIGLRVLSRDGARAELGPHGADNALVELREKRGVRTVPRAGLLGLYHFAILYPSRASLGSFLGHLAQAGVRAAMSDHLVSEAIYLQDPDNLGIEVYADRPREAWTQHGDEIAMATQPLDAQALLDAGGGRAFAGVPAGTVLGHVHLHVGDIAGAERFYHETLGFDKMVWSYPGALFLAAGGYHHHLGTNTWSRQASASDDDAKLVEWEVVVPTAEDVANAARALGVNAGDRGALASDPWGTRVRVIAAA